MNTTTAYFLENVKTGDTVIARFSTQDINDPNIGWTPNWSNPQLVSVYVQRREKLYKERRNGQTIIHPLGELVIFTVQNGCWAEHGIGDWCANDNSFMTENYRMEIKSWNGQNLIK